jgi:hypothetical protein
LRLKVGKISEVLVWIPGAIVVLGAAILGRWLASVHRRVNDHAERIAHLEGRNAERDAGAEDTDAAG